MRGSTYVTAELFIITSHLIQLQQLISKCQMSSDELLLFIFLICSTTSSAGKSFQVWSILFFTTFFFFNFTKRTSWSFSSKMQLKKNHLTFYCDFIFSEHYFYTLFSCWLCRLFGSFPTLGVSEKEIIISFYASYDLFLKLSWPAFLFFTFNLSEFLFLSTLFFWHNFSFLNFALKQWAKGGLIALSGSSYGLR